jgi:hypothetical protein
VFWVLELGKSDETSMSDADKSPHRFIVGRTRETYCLYYRSTFGL